MPEPANVPPVPPVQQPDVPRLERHPFDDLADIERAAPRQHRPWSLALLLVPVLSVIYPPLYNHVDPRLAGLPFFVWYQFAAIALGAVVTGVVYVLRGTERALTR